ncbi:AAA family ATPase [Pseudomonas syringae]|nr:AAA family ATPase [Pseudomonas syringae]MDY2563786.1 AAA family ATPase [Pseudomonas syringae]
MKQITLCGIDEVEDITLNFTSALTSICGRNGVGKTSLLKLIYKVLTKEDLGLGVFRDSDTSKLSIKLMRRGKEIDINPNDGIKIPNTFYFDPSTFALKIIEEYKRDTDKNGWMNGTAKYELDEESLLWIGRITGKAYQRITVSEVSHIIEDTTFPYFEACTDSNTYRTEDMGQGEHKILVMAWRFMSLEKDSILIMEEPESFICPVSQLRLMEFITTIANEKKINILMSTHSEHILKEQGISSINVMFLGAKRKIATDHLKALTSLGLTPEKKSVLLVEDLFAKLVLETILKDRDPGIYLKSHIHVLEGESNIQMLSKHYKGIAGLNYIAVYDADQIIQNDEFPQNIPKIFLPSADRLPPEKEVIKSIKPHAHRLAELINFRGDHNDFNAIINRISADSHEFFLDLVKECHDLGEFINLGLVKQSSITLWIELNTILIDQFIFEINNFSHPLCINVLDKSDGETLRYGIVGENLKYQLEDKFDAFPSGHHNGKLAHSAELQKIILTLCD